MTARFEPPAWLFKATNRDAHHATRASVERDGEDAPRLCYLAFDYFNRVHFADRLAPPMILLTPPGSNRAVGDYTPRDPHGIASRIRISPTVARDPDSRLMIATVLHEMIHAHGHEIEHDNEAGYRGHGPRFCRTANEIAQHYGFAECAPKGRGGLANPAHWPNLAPLDVPEASPPDETEPAEPDETEDSEPADEIPTLDPGTVAERNAAVLHLWTLADRAARRGQRHTAHAYRMAALDLQDLAHIEPALRATWGTRK